MGKAVRCYCFCLLLLLRFMVRVSWCSEELFVVWVIWDLNVRESVFT